nr:hypothetical protein [Nitrosomonas nitrosa]
MKARGKGAGRQWVYVAILSAAAMCAPDAAVAQDQEGLAKKLQNPVADLISVPLQNSFDFRVGPAHDGFRWTLNFQPVVPISLNPDWNVISRTILPVVYQSDIFPHSGTQFGLGDTLQSFFFSPAKPGAFIWGVGPVFLLPTGTHRYISGRKWGAGPTGVILVQDSGWTYGALANHIWSFASSAGGNSRPEISATYLQPFVNYTFKSATTLGLNAEMTYDWRAKQWTVPLQASISQLLAVQKQPMQFSLAGRYWAARPDSAPTWGLRFSVTFLFPRQ